METKDEFSFRYKRTLADTMRKVGVSQVELAKRLGLRLCTVNRWVNGERTPSLYNHYRIMSVLKGGENGS